MVTRTRQRLWRLDGRRKEVRGGWQSMVVSARKGKSQSVTVLQRIYDTAIEAVIVGVMVGHR
ncbi:kinesin-like protein [Sesbania bispinosa]|nr:kinesin-like protein [Sesbania bispinosa]